MKRSRYVQLSLAASVALVVSGCGQQEKTYSLKKDFTFQSVAQCTEQKFPVDVCSDAYIAAMAEHRRSAPVYDNQADCDADFVADYCQADSSGKFVPRLSGFHLTADGTVTQSQVDAAKAQTGESGSGSGFSGSSLLTGLLIGNLISNNMGRFSSAPVYNHRDSRGGFATSTLGQRIRDGSTFNRSRQSQSGQGFSTNNTRPSSVASGATRGGFGSSASARSGWGGSSKSFGG
jgi:uncharacterized protein YgiB involved in biofilm formation